MIVLAKREKTFRWAARLFLGLVAVRLAAALNPPKDKPAAQLHSHLSSLKKQKAIVFLFLSAPSQLKKKVCLSMLNEAAEGSTIQPNKLIFFSAS